MNSEVRSALLYFSVMCSPILLLLIWALLSGRFNWPASFNTLTKSHGWVVQAHPKDHRDYLFTGRLNGVDWEMEYYFFEHYRKRILSAKQIPYIKVIVWTTNDVSLVNNTLWIYPRKDKLKHLVHPRLTVTSDLDARTVQANKEPFDTVVATLPERSMGSSEIQELFVLRTDLEVIPLNLLDTFQADLSSWSKFQLVGPIILINNSGITIWWIPIGMKNEWLEKTVKLGLSLADAL